MNRVLLGKPYQTQAWRSEDVVKSYRDAQKARDQQWLQSQIQQMRKAYNTDIEI